MKSRPVPGAVWISGSSSGIGKACTEALPWPSARCISISRRGSSSSTHLCVDLSEPAGWEVVNQSFAEALKNEPGRVLFIHCAADPRPFGPAIANGPLSARASLQLNAVSAIALATAFIGLCDQHDCDFDVVMFGSPAAEKAAVGLACYGAAKAAVEQWARIVTEERRHTRGGRIYVVRPGVVDSAMTNSAMLEDASTLLDTSRLRQLHESKEFVSPVDVASAIYQILDAPEAPMDPVVTLNLDTSKALVIHL